VFLIVLTKTIGRESEFAHAIIFILTMVAFAAFVWKIKPYNYNRFNLWQFLIFAAVIWLAFLAFINISVGFNSPNSAIAVAVLLFGGWAGIMACGLVW
jgi:hypothetical protein